MCPVFVHTEYHHSQFQKTHLQNFWSRL